MFLILLAECTSCKSSLLALIVCVYRLPDNMNCAFEVLMNVLPVIYPAEESIPTVDREKIVHTGLFVSAHYWA